MWRHIKQTFASIAFLVRTRATERANLKAVKQQAATKKKFPSAAYSPATPADLSKLSKAELEARVNHLRASLVVSQQAQYQEQLNRVHQAAESTAAVAQKAAQQQPDDAEAKAIREFQARLDAMDIDREAYISEITASNLRSLEKEEFGLSSHAAGPIFTASATNTTTTDDTSPLTPTVDSDHDSGSTSTTTATSSSSSSAASQQEVRELDRLTRQTIEEATKGS